MRPHVEPLQVQGAAVQDLLPPDPLPPSSDGPRGDEDHLPAAPSTTRGRKWQQVMTTRACVCGLRAITQESHLTRTSICSMRLPRRPKARRPSQARDTTWVPTCNNEYATFRDAPTQVCPCSYSLLSFWRPAPHLYDDTPGLAHVAAIGLAARRLASESHLPKRLADDAH